MQTLDHTSSQHHAFSGKFDRIYTFHNSQGTFFIPFSYTSLCTIVNDVVLCNAHEHKPIDITMSVWHYSLLSPCKKTRNALTSLHFPVIFFTTKTLPKPLSYSSNCFLQNPIRLFQFVPLPPQKHVLLPVASVNPAAPTHQASAHCPVLRPSGQRKPHHPGVQAHMYHFLGSPSCCWYDNFHTMA